MYEEYLNNGNIIINSDDYQSFFGCEEFADILYDDDVRHGEHIIHEKMFLRIKKDDNEKFEIEDIEKIKKTLIIYNWSVDYSKKLINDLDLETNLFLCHKFGRHEEFIEKNMLLSENAIVNHENYYEINQKYMFELDHEYYYDVPLFFDFVNICDVKEWGIAEHRKIDINIWPSLFNVIEDKYRCFFLSEKLKILKKKNENKIIITKTWHVFKYCRNILHNISLFNIKNAIIKSKDMLNIDEQNIEYYMEIYNGLFYYYFNTLDLDELMKQEENIKIYEPHESEESSILAYYIFALRSVEN